MALLLEGYGECGEGRLASHNKKGQYRERTSIPPDIYHILYRVTFREILEGYWEKRGREIGGSQ